jgi:hypothetical protein
MHSFSTVPQMIAIAVFTHLYFETYGGNNNLGFFCLFVCLFVCLFCFVSNGTGAWTQGLTLAKQALYTLAILPALQFFLESPKPPTHTTVATRMSWTKHPRSSPFICPSDALRLKVWVLNHGTPNGLFPWMHIHNSVFVAAESVQASPVHRSHMYSWSLQRKLGKDQVRTRCKCAGELSYDLSPRFLFPFSSIINLTQLPFTQKIPSPMQKTVKWAPMYIHSLGAL